VVATPIGNAADITLRALWVLSKVDAIAAEDTRTTGALLRRYGIDTPLLAAHRHNENERPPRSSSACAPARASPWPPMPVRRRFPIPARGWCAPRSTPACAWCRCRAPVR